MCTAETNGLHDDALPIIEQELQLLTTLTAFLAQRNDSLKSMQDAPCTDCLRDNLHAPKEGPGRGGTIDGLDAKLSFDVWCMTLQ